MVSDEDGTAAVRLARRSTQRALEFTSDDTSRVAVSPVFSERRGAFVTWKRHPSGELRGCIGFPEPVLPLRQAIEEAAVAAALEDPRFAPIELAELLHVTAEVSVLGSPAVVPVGDRPGAVLPGRYGVIVGSGRHSGLLLPQVACEMGWSAEQLLDGACEKAGLLPGAWRRPEVDVRTFGAEVFGERLPAGPVARVLADRPAAHSRAA